MRNWALSARNPELKRRIGSEWTREHYWSHRRDRNQRFLNAKIDLIDELMNQRGINYLVVAGSPERVSRLKSELPEHLKRRLVSMIAARPTFEPNCTRWSTMWPIFLPPFTVRHLNPPR